MKRLKYTRRFVNVNLAQGGKRKVRIKPHIATTTSGWVGLEQTYAARRPHSPSQGFGSHNPIDEPQPRCGLSAPFHPEWNNLGPDRRIETTGLADTAHRGTKNGFHKGKWDGRLTLEHRRVDGFLGAGHYAIYTHVSAAALWRRASSQSGARGRLVLSLHELLENLIDLSGPKRVAPASM